jgi:antitoxin HicB
MKNKHRGSSFDDFLKEEGLFEECNAEAVKRVIAFQLERELMMKTRIMSKEMHTSCAIVNHTLEPEEICSKSPVMVSAE